MNEQFLNPEPKRYYQHFTNSTIEIHPESLLDYYDELEIDYSRRFGIDPPRHLVIETSAKDDSVTAHFFSVESDADTFIAENPNCRAKPQLPFIVLN